MSQNHTLIKRPHLYKENAQCIVMYMYTVTEGRFTVVYWGHSIKDNSEWLKKNFLVRAKISHDPCNHNNITTCIAIIFIYTHTCNEATLLQNACLLSGTQNSILQVHGQLYMRVKWNNKESILTMTLLMCTAVCTCTSYLYTFLSSLGQIAIIIQQGYTQDHR